MGQNNLDELLKEALKWGLHDDACNSFKAKWDDFQEQERLCNCWIKQVKDYLKPVVEYEVCTCGHTSKLHSKGIGVCVANGCDCFNFIRLK